MDMNQYIVFLEIAKLQNLSKAAKSLGYTQSGISHMLKRLETEMNLKLFYRDRNGAYLTKAGEEVYPIISQIVQCHENLKQTVQSLHNLHMGALNIGTYSSISREWLPHIIQIFKQDFPHIKIHFKEGGNEDIMRWIENHEVDFGLLSLGSSIKSKTKKANTTSIEWIPLKDDPLLAVLPPRYEKENLEAFPLENFNNQTFILSAFGVDLDVHHTLKSHKITPDIQYSAMDDFTIVSMVACDLGISILPKLVLDHHDTDVLTLPLKPYTTRQLGVAIASKEMASPAALKFIEYTEQYVKAL